MYRLFGASFVTALLVAFAPPARGEPWVLSVEAPAALAIAEPQRSLFGAGALPAATAYRAFNANLLAGLRLRAGAFANGPPPADRGVRDPGVGGLGTLTVALRVRPLASAGEISRTRGLWTELAAGPGLTGTLVRATVEAGVGWGFRAGAHLTLGPSLRYLQVIQPADALDGRDARLALIGVEAALFDARPVPAPVAVAAPLPPPPPLDSDGDGILDRDDRCPQQPEDRDGFEDADGCPDPDNDHDGILDSADRCPNQPEVVNGVEDEDGCPDQGLIELVGDRIVLEERVLFDSERARVKTAARPHLAAIVELWRQHPEWESLTIEGHTDSRGPDRFNDWLSDTRAERVRAVLVELGMPGDFIRTRGYGRSRPRVPESTPEAQQQNRRVEFVVTRKPVAPSAPAPTTPAPAPVVPPALVPEAVP